MRASRNKRVKSDDEDDEFGHAIAHVLSLDVRSKLAAQEGVEQLRKAIIEVHNHVGCAQRILGKTEERYRAFGDALLQKIVPSTRLFQCSVFCEGSTGTPLATFDAHMSHTLHGSLGAARLVDTLSNHFKLSTVAENLRATGGGVVFQELMMPEWESKVPTLPLDIKNMKSKLQIPGASRCLRMIASGQRSCFRAILPGFECMLKPFVYQSVGGFEAEWTMWAALVDCAPHRFLATDVGGSRQLVSAQYVSDAVPVTGQLMPRPKGRAKAQPAGSTAALSAQDAPPGAARCHHRQAVSGSSARR